MDESDISSATSLGRGGGGNPDRRHRVLQAARETVLRLGYDKAGPRDIAARAKLSKSALYLDFASKEALIDELIQTESVAFATALFAAAASSQRAPPSTAPCSSGCADMGGSGPASTSMPPRRY